MRSFSAIALLLALGLLASPLIAQDLRHASLFVMTDEISGNRVVAYHRDAEGHLTEAGRYATGGAGLGLGQNLFFSQQALVISGDYLLVPNSGSNTVTSMRILADRLEPVSTVPSFGLHPFGFSSVRTLSSLHLDAVPPEMIRPNNAFGEGVFYVFNSLSGNIAGFELQSDGKLRPLPDALRTVSGSLISRPGQVDFTPDGRFLLVTESAFGVGRIVNSFAVRADGILGERTESRSASNEPFGFSWDRNHHMLLTEGNTAIPGLGAVSSYDVGEDGRLETLSANVVNGQNTTCWIQYTDRTQVPFAYAQDVFGIVSSYAVDRENGALTLVDPRAAISGAGGTVTLTGLDLLIVDNRTAFGDERQYLYALHALNGIVAYRIEPDGRLTALPEAGAPGILSPALGERAVFPRNTRYANDTGFASPNRGLLGGLGGFGTLGTGGLPLDPVGLLAGVNRNIGIEPLLTDVLTPLANDLYTGPLSPALESLSSATVPASILGGSLLGSASSALASLAALDLPLTGLPVVSAPGLAFSATGLAGR